MGMDLDTNATALVCVLKNQTERMHAALEELPQEAFDAEQPNGCNSIRAIGAHLIMLCRFQLVILESDRAANIPDDNTGTTPELLRAALADAHELIRQAIVEHDASDWMTTPATPREGKWGDEATMLRFVRPFNDFVNHLGAIRAIRRTMGVPNDRTQ